MVGNSRATIPGEYFDRTSNQMLVQPEPQYLYAGFFLGALALSLSPDGMASPGRPLLASTGADYTAANADRLMMAQAIPSQLMAVKADFAAQSGATLRINRPAYENTTYTDVSRMIQDGASISTTPIKIQATQNNITLYKFGGPYDQINTRVAPFSIEAFDANMGVHSQPSIVASQLVRDFHKWIDAVHVAILDKGSVVVYPEGMTADNDATAVGSFPFTLEQLNRAEQVADSANLPTLADGFRLFVATPVQLKQLKDDPQYARSAEYFPEYNILFPNYVKSVGKTHIFKSNTLTIKNNSSTVPIHYGHYVCPGVLMGGMGRKPRVAASTDDNFGETVKVVWIADLAFKIANSDFVLSVRSSA